MVVKLIPSPKTQQEAAKNKGNVLGEPSPDWWMVWLTGAIVFIGVIQTVVFGIQAKRLKQTIDKMDAISAQQTKDVRASITEATRAAKAMEDIAGSTASNVESVKTTVAINREIADRQKLVTELQSRAYLTSVFDFMIPQDQRNGVKFEPRIRIVNKGNTPARNVRFTMRAEVLPMPLSDDFNFPLSEKMLDSSSDIGPGLDRVISAVVPEMLSATEAHEACMGGKRRAAAWGIVQYRDAFEIERFVRFGVTYTQFGTTWMSWDTPKHNESD